MKHDSVAERRGAVGRGQGEMSPHRRSAAGHDGYGGLKHDMETTQTMKRKARCLFHSMGTRILTLIGAMVVLALVWMVVFYTKQQEEGILAQNERTMTLLTDGLSRGLQTVMLAGYADIAQQYADNLKHIPNVEDFRILRINGLEAFQDNKTIASVNLRIGEEEFIPREEEREVMVLPAEDPELKQAVADRKTLFSYSDESDGDRHLTFLVPIVNQEKCRKCHGGDQPVRGVIKLTTSLEKARAEIHASRFKAVQVLLSAVIIILMVIYLLVRGTLVRPVVRMTQAMTHIAAGNLQQKVPVLGCDELAVMAESFNSMSGELEQTLTGLQLERDKLNTILYSAQEGIIVTDRKGEVVLVNPAAERLLGKGAEEITRAGFVNILDDPKYIQTFLERGGVDMPDTVVYNDRILTVNAATIRAANGQVTGSAALIRDVTEEKKLEKQLRKLSTTDALTGLFNRRRFDEALNEELTRARRYSLEVALLLFDVDHFKKFNDTHGHDQGDRVLQAIGRQMQIVFREIDYPCRYGGEEFCVILPSTGVNGGMMAAERLRKAVEQMEVDGLKVTISIGVATFPGTGAYKTPDEMLKAADNVLYVSKKGGRNRSSLAGEKEGDSPSV